MAIFVKFFCTIAGAAVGFAIGHALCSHLLQTNIRILAGLVGMGAGIWLGLGVGWIILEDAPKPLLPK